MSNICQYQHLLIKQSFKTGYGATGQITSYVQVPLRVVGLVVGPNGVNLHLLDFSLR